MAFNILTKNIADSSTLHLVDPATGELMYADEAETQPLEVVIYGKASKQYRQELSAMARKRDSRKEKKVTFDQTVIENNEFLAALSIKANNFDMNGDAVDSFDQFMKLYSTPGLYWIKDQVSAFIGDDASFLEN